MFFNQISLEGIMYRLPAVIIGFTMHEFMHAYTADRMGDPTPRSHGRVTLNPLVHIDWLGFFFLMFAGFGWAKPVPTTPSNYKNYTKGRLLVSLAGPLANLSLAFLAFAVYYFGYGHFFINSSFWCNILNVFIYINILLFAINILPIPPLDGFTLLELIIKPDRYRTLYKFRQYAIFILILLSFTGILGKYISFVYDLFAKASLWIFNGINLFIGLF